jgi:hypothetical protein
MTILQNHIILQPGIPAQMHFSDHHIEYRDITDPLTQQTKRIQTLVFDVDELDGHPVTASYSTISVKHAQQFAPYLEDKSYKNFICTITKTGSGFMTDWIVNWKPRP